MADPVRLTFDDGPDPRWTPRVLELLALHGVIATFFMVGQRALQHPGVARAVVAAGHGLGNHSFSHRHPWRMREADARREVCDGTKALEDVCGRPVPLFRPPFGRVRQCMTAEAALCGQAQVLWDRSAIDWGPLGRSVGIARRLARVQPGEIVLMHDGAGRHNHPDQLLRALPGLLWRLGENGMHSLGYPGASARLLPGGIHEYFRRSHDAQGKERQDAQYQGNLEPPGGH